MNKRILLSLIATSLLVLNACSELENQDGPEVPMAFTAIAIEEETNTVVQPDSKFMWAPGDEICVFSGSSKGARFSTQIEEPAVQAEFKGNLYGYVKEDGDFDQFWAIYPYISGVSCDGSGVVACLPHEQSALAGAIASNTNIKLAQSANSTLSFYNVCTGLWFAVDREGIESVTLQGNNNEDVAGQFQVSMGGDGKPTQPIVISGQKSITLCPPQGKTFQVGQKYCFVILPQTFSEGITLTFKTATESVSRSSSGSHTFKRAAFEYSIVTDQEVVFWQESSPDYMYEIIEEEREGFDTFIVSSSGTHYIAVGDDEEYGKVCALGAFDSDEENIVTFMDESGVPHKIVFQNHCLDFYYHEDDDLVDILHIDENGNREWLTDLEIDLIHRGPETAQSHETKAYTPYDAYDMIVSVVGLVRGKGAVGKLLEGIALVANIAIPDEYELFNTIVDIHILALSAAFIPAFGTAAVGIGMALIAIQTTHAIITSIQNGVINRYLPHVSPITQGLRFNDYDDVTLFAGVVSEDKEYNNDFQVGIILAGVTFISKHHCIEYKETSYVTSKDRYDFSFSLPNYKPGSNFQYAAFLEPNQKSDRYSNHKHILDYCKYGDTESFSIPIPAANIDEIVDITEHAAKVICSYSNLLPSARCGVEVNSSTSSMRYYGNPNGEGEAVINLNGLQPGTEYDCHAFVEVNSYEYYNETGKSFTTSLEQPSAFTGDIISVTENSATVECRFSGVPDGATCGVMLNGKRIIYASENDTSVVIDGLDPGTSYKYRAFVCVNDTFYYGETKTVTTSFPDVTGLWYCTEYHYYSYNGKLSHTESYTVVLDRNGTATCTGDREYKDGDWSQTKDELDVSFSIYSSTMMEGLKLNIVFDDFRNPVSGKGTANIWWYVYSIGREGGDYLELKMTR